MTIRATSENPERPIDELRNLGPKSVRLLTSVGIETIEQLQDLGAVFAFVAVKTRHPEATLNLLWSLAAGLEEREWRSLSQREKETLREEVKRLLQ